MSHIVQVVEPSAPVALPVARVDVSVRPGTPDDLPFIDALQKQHNKQLGFMNRPTLEGKVALGHVLIAESNGTRVGYLIGNDRYQHRDELGVIFQLCVAPEYRRSLVAAHLLRAQFERSAYGCKLYCCWCAQDLPANRFYEAMGFVPIAYRAGSEKKNRTHIFWQKRIRAGDTTTPWWFPSETRGGLMDAARIALPIPPGTHWSDELPRLVPTARLTSEVTEEQPARERKPKAATPTRPRGGLYFGPPPAAEPDGAPPKPKRVKKASPELAAKARELRDRYLEQFNAQPPALPSGKYYLTRQVQVERLAASDGRTKLLAA